MADSHDAVLMELRKYEDEKEELEVLAAELQQNPKFAEFLEAQKSFNAYQSEVWKKIETMMIESNTLSIKTDKVTLSIAEKTSFDIDLEKLPAKYFKTVPDTTKILGMFKLEGKPVKGTTPKFTKYLVKRIK